MPTTNRAFTLIELLVVITIIVVLLALLTPALDAALYQAELAQCGAKLSAMARGANVYAAASRRSYPWRANVHGRGWKPNVLQVATDPTSDERPVMTRAIGPLNKMLNDPFLEDVDFEGSPLESNIESDYNLWLGFGYRGEKGMYRLGDGFEWAGRRYRWIASDSDLVNSAGNPPSFLASHADLDGKMTERVMQDEGAVGGISIGPAAWTQYTLSRWELTDNVTLRGPLDKHHAADDGSVARYERVTPDDERMTRTPCTADPTQFPSAEQFIPLR